MLLGRHVKNFTSDFPTSKPTAYQQVYTPASRRDNVTNTEPSYLFINVTHYMLVQVLKCGAGEVWRRSVGLIM